ESQPSSTEGPNGLLSLRPTGLGTFPVLAMGSHAWKLGRVAIGKTSYLSDRAVDIYHLRAADSGIDIGSCHRGTSRCVLFQASILQDRLRYNDHSDFRIFDASFLVRNYAHRNFLVVARLVA